MYTTWILVSATLAVASAADKAKECKTLCGCAARLRKRLGALKNELDAGRRQNEQNKNDMIKLMLAAISADDNTIRKIAPVLAASGAVLADCDDKLADAWEQYDRTARRTEQLATLYAAQHAVMSGSSKMTIQLANGNAQLTGAGYDLTTSIGTLGTKECKNDTTDDEHTGEITEDGDEAEKAPPKLITAVNLLGRCQAGNTDSQSCAGNNFAQQGKIEITLQYAKQAGDKQTWPAMNADPAVVGSAPQDLIGKANEEVHFELKSLAAQIKNLNCRKDIKTYSAVASNPLYKLLLTKTQQGKEDAESGDELKGDELKAVTSNRYGDDGKNFKANLWDAIDNSPAYLGKGKTEETTQLKKIETLAKVGEASARALVKHLKNKHASTEKAAKADQNIECSGKKGDECKGRCELVGNTCKAKAKADGKNAKYERTASTCTGKLEDTCEKDTGCKWENNACKDSSFLVNKKLFWSMDAVFISTVAL
uniref:Variant surface glycoprotein 1125.1103 n=1 Tax=Trypanosoma brucei TaxID=5691 RepID=A0A1J0R687_9TRYP|nr:variant surface glycoprotein 1125.1103 [Trypanosoma brucei]